MGIIRSIDSVVCFIWVISMVVISSIPSIIAVIINPGGMLSHRILKLAAKSMLWFSRVKVSIDGMENIDLDNPQIIASNHISQFDIVVLFAILPVKMGWVAKKELFKIPFLGWLMKANGYVGIDRSSGRKAIKSIIEAAEKVKNGSNIVIFPEGTRSRDGNLLPFKKGVFHLCTRTGVPIIPVYIKGTEKVLKADSLKIRPGKVNVTIGKPLQTSDYPTNKAGKLMGDLREKIIELQEATAQPPS